MELISFTQQQSSAINSIVFVNGKTVKIRYQSSPTAYTFKGVSNVIRDLKEYAQECKLDTDKSIGKYVHNLMKNEELVRVDFTFKFDHVFDIGDKNRSQLTTNWCLQFKTVYYTFIPVEGKKQINIIKQKKKNSGEYEIVMNEILTVGKARRKWVNLTKGRRTVKTAMFNYYHD
jgi:hypothetical protein